jgi:hypothetical protein
LPGSGIRDGKIRIRDRKSTHITKAFTESILNTASITITALKLGIDRNNLTDGLRYNDIRMNFHVQETVGKNVCLELSVADLEQHVLLLVQDSRESSPAVSASERPLPCSRHMVYTVTQCCGSGSGIREDPVPF